MQYGGYGEEVITAGCGPVIEGSIPSSHPIKNPSRNRGIFVLLVRDEPEYYGADRWHEAAEKPEACI